MRGVNVGGIFLAIILWLLFTDDGSSASRGWLWGPKEPTHTPLIVALTNYLDRQRMPLP